MKFTNDSLEESDNWPDLSDDFLEEKNSLANDIFGTESPLLTKRKPESSSGRGCIWTDSSDDSLQSEVEDLEAEEDVEIAPAANFSLQFDETIEDSLDDQDDPAPAAVSPDITPNIPVLTKENSLIDLTDLEPDQSEEFFRAVKIGRDLARTVRADSDDAKFQELSQVCIEIVANLPIQDLERIKDVQEDIELIQNTVKKFKSKVTNPDMKISSKLSDIPPQGSSRNVGQQKANGYPVPNSPVLWSDDDDDLLLQSTEVPPATSTGRPAANASFVGGIDNFVGDARNDGTDRSLNTESFPHSAKTRKLMKERFRIKNFRTNQLPAINSALLGHDTFVLMPTGGGTPPSDTPT